MLCYNVIFCSLLKSRTITEESPAPVVTQRSTRTKRNAAKTTANDVAETNAVNKETVALIANSVAVVPQAISATEQTVTKTTTVITSKTVKNSSGEHLLNEKQHQSQTVTKSSSSATTRSREANQNESNLLLEQNAKLKTSTPRANKDASANNSNNSSFNNISITNGTNLEDHAAFKEYKEAGEYWNKFPKTDYTYSKLSQQRREIKPGVIAMPNMSRRSLEHHQTRVNDMIRRDPAQESFFRSRYEALTTLRKRRAAENYYDSQDETDLSFGLNGSRSYVDTRSFFRRVITVITTFFSTIYYRTTTIFRREQPNVYYARFAEPKKGTTKQISHPVLFFIFILFFFFCFKRYHSTILGQYLQRIFSCVPLHLSWHLIGFVLGFVGFTIVIKGQQEEGFPHWTIDSIATSSVGR